MSKIAALSYMLGPTLAFSFIVGEPSSAQNLWQTLQQQAKPFLKSAVGKVKQNIQGGIPGSGNGQGNGSLPPPGYGNGYQPANDRGQNGTPGSGYHGGGYQSQGNDYPPQDNANQGNTYQPDYQPNSGYPPQGNGYQPQGNGYQPQGNGYQPQGNRYQPQGMPGPPGYAGGPGGEESYGVSTSPAPGNNAPNYQSSAPTPNPNYKPVHLGGGRMNSRQMFQQPGN